MTQPRTMNPKDPKTGKFVKRQRDPADTVVYQANDGSLKRWPPDDFEIPSPPHLGTQRDLAHHQSKQPIEHATPRAPLWAWIIAPAFLVLGVLLDRLSR